MVGLSANRIGIYGEVGEAPKRKIFLRALNNLTIHAVCRCLRAVFFASHYNPLIITLLRVGPLYGICRSWHKTCGLHKVHNSNRVQIEACLGASGYRKREDAVA